MKRGEQLKAGMWYLMRNGRHKRICGFAEGWDGRPMVAWQGGLFDGDIGYCQESVFRSDAVRQLDDHEVRP